MIYEVDGQFVISSRRSWIPGVFDSRRAANYAFRFQDEVLIRLQDEVNKIDPERAITFEMLQAEYQKGKAN